jgi:hypothetical protein
MNDNTKQQMNFPQTYVDGDTCGLSQKQARKEMRKEDERKQISKMMKKL